ncbi:MAG: DM13 domain-containing protein [Gemmataceae bacterium]|nr:DM13 domain-containing protein [Gemmataceae bacterium]
MTTIKCAMAAAFVAAAGLLAAGPAAAQDKPKPLASGEFHKVEKDAKGKATVYQAGDGKRTLRLSDFETENGPDLHVVLIDAEDAKDADTVKKAKKIELGKLKGNKGNQNYELPADADMAKVKTVVIWCERFELCFAAAPLKDEK